MPQAAAVVPHVGTAAVAPADAGTVKQILSAPAAVSAMVWLATFTTVPVTDPNDTPSAVVSFTYTQVLTAGFPTISPAAGARVSGTPVTLGSTHAGWGICFRKDGNTAGCGGAIDTCATGSTLYDDDAAVRSRGSIERLYANLRPFDDVHIT